MNEEAMLDAFFRNEAPQDRDDDKCLIWISLKEGESLHENQK